MLKYDGISYIHKTITGIVAENSMSILYSQTLCIFTGFIALLFAIFSATLFKRTISKLQQVKIEKNLTGAQVASGLLTLNGLDGIRVLATPGNLTDHYDIESKAVYLSLDTAMSTHIAAIGIVAHEIGHALQDSENYFLLRYSKTLTIISRITLLPLILILATSYIIKNPVYLIIIGWIMFFIGLGSNLMLGVLNKDAGKRGETWLREGGFITNEEYKLISILPTLSFLTYVIGTITGILQLFFYLQSVVKIKKGNIN